jgi:branched-subunit amino acid aminotransferase/4-amino-4-deoxychorismate lyase
MESALYETAKPDLKIIETLQFDGTGFVRLAEHLDRAEATADLLGFPFERGECLGAIGGAVASGASRVRMTLDRAGLVEVTAVPFDLDDRIWNVAISETRLDSSDPFLAVKTSERTLYDTVRGDLPRGIDEIIFLNERGEVCEGTITNVFVEIDGILVTPPLPSGLLPGVLRASLLDEGRAIERVLTRDDLAAGDLFLGNSLRGLIRAQLV